MEISTYKDPRLEYRIEHLVILILQGEIHFAFLEVAATHGLPIRRDVPLLESD